MYVGFALRHAGKWAVIGAATIAGAVLSTKSGRRAAKVAGAALKGAVEAGWVEVKATKCTEKATQQRA